MKTLNEKYKMRNEFVTYLNEQNKSPAFVNFKQKMRQMEKEAYEIRNRR